MTDSTEGSSDLKSDLGRRIWAFLTKYRSLPFHVPIAYKFAFAIALVILASMTILGLGILNRQTRLMRNQIYNFGKTVTDQMAESARDPILTDNLFGLELLVTNLGNDRSILGAAVLSVDGNMLAQSGVTPLDIEGPFFGARNDFVEQDRQIIEWFHPKWGEGPRNVITFIHPSRIRDLNVGWVMVTFNNSALNESLRASVRTIIIVTFIMIILGVILSVFIGRRLSRPIYDLVDASKAMSAGDYEYRFTERRNDEIGHLMSSFNDMAEGILQKTQVEEVFSRYVSPDVAKEILANLQEVSIGGKHVEASVLFADIVGFTALSEQLEPDEIAKLLNDYFGHFTRAAAFYKGTVDKYIGDCAMLVFGVPREDPDHCFHSIACAVLIRELLNRLSRDRSERGLVTVEFRIGVNTGRMLAGNMGSADRMQYTVVGDSVNLASRLCSVAGPGQIVITEETYEYPDLKNHIVTMKHEQMNLRGKTKPINSFVVLDIEAEHREAMIKEIESILEEGMASES